MKIDKSYIEKVYLFARSKTRSVHEAEDLAQDILTEVISSLKKGTKPRNFSAWFWTIARRKYAQFIDKERLYRLTWQLDYQIQDSQEYHHNDIDYLHERLAKDDDLKIMFREISLLSKIYRQIVIMHYIEEKSVREISSKLNIPAGTVKRRLHDARKILMKGMNRLTHITGKRSFMPDSLSIWTNGSSANLQGYIRRQLPKNILSIAAHKPVTIDELCGEIGLAKPYMEEEVELLQEVTLLKKVNQSAFESDFIILNRPLANNLRAKITRTADQLASEAYSKLDGIKEQLLALDFSGNKLAWNLLRWIFILRMADSLVENAEALAMKTIEQRDTPTYEKPWYIWGIREQDMEYASIPDPTLYPNQRHYRLPGQDCIAMYVSYQSEGCLPLRTDELDLHATDIILKIAFSNQALAHFSDDEKEILAGLIAKGIIKRENNRLTPCIPIFNGGHNGRIRSIMNKAVQPFAHKAAQLWLEIYHQLTSEVEHNLHNQINNYIRWFMGQFHSSFIEYGLKADLLSQRSSDNDPPLEAMYILYGDTFFEQKVFPLFDASIKSIKELSKAETKETTLLDHLETRIQQLVPNKTTIKKEKHDVAFRLGGKMHTLNNAEYITQISAEDIDLWVAKFANHEQAIRNVPRGSHTYTGRPLYEDSQQIIWVVWSMVTEGVNSCFALFNLNNFLIAFNVETGIDIEILKETTWENIINQPGVKQRVKASVEKIEQFLQQFTAQIK